MRHLLLPAATAELRFASSSSSPQLNPARKTEVGEKRHAVTARSKSLLLQHQGRRRCGIGDLLRLGSCLAVHGRWNDLDNLRTRSNGLSFQNRHRYAITSVKCSKMVGSVLVQWSKRSKHGRENNTARRKVNNASSRFRTQAFRSTSRYLKPDTA